VAAFVELPEFMTGPVVERFYAAVLKGSEQGSRSHIQTRRIDRGLRMARARDGHLLKFLEKSAEVLRACSESQQDRLDEGKEQVIREGGDVVARIRTSFPKQDFSEYSTVKEAYVAADNGDPILLRVFGHIYAAAADSILGEL